MSVSAEELDRGVPLDLSDRFEYCIVFGRVKGHVAGDKEEVDVSVVDRFQKPFLLNGLFDCFNDDVVGIASEVEEKAES